MLIGDDDDGVLEDTAISADEDEAPPSPAAASEPDDDHDASGDVRAADFELMPHVVKLLEAHAAGEGAAGMRALRRALRRAEGRIARVLDGAEAAIDGDEAAARDARLEELLCRQPKRKRGGGS